MGRNIMKACFFNTFAPNCLLSQEGQKPMCIMAVGLLCAFVLTHNIHMTTSHFVSARRPSLSYTIHECGLVIYQMDVSIEFLFSDAATLPCPAAAAEFLRAHPVALDMRAEWQICISSQLTISNTRALDEEPFLWIRECYCETWRCCLTMWVLLSCMMSFSSA